MAAAVSGGANGRNQVFRLSALWNRPGEQSPEHKSRSEERLAEDSSGLNVSGDHAPGDNLHDARHDTHCPNDRHDPNGDYDPSEQEDPSGRVSKPNDYHTIPTLHRPRCNLELDTLAQAPQQEPALVVARKPGKAPRPQGPAPVFQS
jgi:hypothetical protein